ncbi:MAG: EAL domain-containing protein [Burkholderiales bacterium]
MLALPTPSGNTAIAGASRAAGPRTTSVIAVRAVALVAGIQLALLALFHFGWLPAAAYAVAAIVVPSAAAGWLVQSHTQLLRRLRRAMRQFEAGAPEDGAPAAVADASPDLAVRLERLHARTLERVEELKAARKAAQLAGREKRRMARHLNRAQRVARVGSWEWDRATNRVVCSAELQRMLGIDGERFAAAPAALLPRVHKDDRRAFRRWLVNLARGRAASGLDARVRTRSGEYLQVRMMGEALGVADGSAGSVVGTIQDATEHAEAIHEVHQLAYYDVLTELPNRSRFHERLVETLDFASRTSTSFALMFLDLDQFKRINDTLGHAVGDELLRVVAQRLTRVLRIEEGAGPTRGGTPERDVCRQGGDEFVVLLAGVATEEHAARAARRVLDTLAQPIKLSAHEVFVSASVGIVLYPRDGNNLDTLLRNADVAMYNAKAEGRNRHAFYRESMREATAQRLSLEHDLRRAIEAEQFVLHYQPQIDVSTGAVVGVEALVRWNHPTLGLLPPSEFIPVAEEAGLIMAIWEWVFVSALIQHNDWLQDGLPPIAVGVNLSSVQFADTALAGRVQEIAQVIGVPLDCIELEITESALMGDFDTALATLNALREMGVAIAIDDFGTGYSSLSYLRRLPLRKLKLDIAFIRDAVESDEAAAIVAAIIAIANSLKLDVVAEGVETQAQCDFLVESGCTTMQGYLLSRPVTGQAIADLLRGGRRDAVSGQEAATLQLQ